MISLEKARELKAAGLQWEPKKWDLYTMEPAVIDGRKIHHGTYCINHKLYDLARAVMSDRFWLPSLSQLLAEIERHGYTWEMGLATTRGGSLDPGVHKSGYWCEVFQDGKLAHGVTLTETIEDAAAEVLLHLLKEVPIVQEG